MCLKEVSTWNFPTINKKYPRYGATSPYAGSPFRKPHDDQSYHTPPPCNHCLHHPRSQTLSITSIYLSITTITYLYLQPARSSLHIARNLITILIPRSTKPITPRITTIDLNLPTRAHGLFCFLSYTCTACPTGGDVDVHRSEFPLSATHAFSGEEFIALEAVDGVGNWHTC